jgi:hypothetical protein
MTGNIKVSSNIFTINKYIEKFDVGSPIMTLLSNSEGPIDIIRNSSIRSLFKGLGSTLFRDVYSYGIYFQQYHFWKETLHENSLSVFIAGVCACVLYVLCVNQKRWNRWVNLMDYLLPS